MFESALLNEIVSSPADDEARLVYADWLAERDEPRAHARAAFLRAQVKGRKPRNSRALGPEWLASVDRTGIDNCHFAFECPKRWQDLQPTAESTVRSCAACQQEVYFCATVGEARAHARQGHCVAVCSLERRSPGDLARVRMGRWMPPRGER